MGNRLFEYPELKMLADAVASSKIISAKKSEALVQKLGCLTSIHQAEQLKGLASLSSRVKPGNEKVYYIIDSIHSAILEHRQIEFQFYEYTQTKEKILIIGSYRDILSVMVNDNTHKLVITLQLNIQCALRGKHINHCVCVCSHIKIFKLSKLC